MFTYEQIEKMLKQGFTPAMISAMTGVDYTHVDSGDLKEADTAKTGKTTTVGGVGHVASYVFEANVKAASDTAPVKTGKGVEGEVWDVKKLDALGKKFGIKYDPAMNVRRRIETEKAWEARLFRVTEATIDAARKASNTAAAKAKAAGDKGIIQAKQQAFYGVIAKAQAKKK